jgi:phosphoribosylanthranilate isomerase
LDTGSLSDSLIEQGGTRRTHDWSISAQIRKQINIPVFLAGGLNPENVSKAIQRVKPFLIKGIQILR